MSGQAVKNIQAMSGEDARKPAAINDEERSQRVRDFFGQWEEFSKKNKNKEGYVDVFSGAENGVGRMPF